MLKFVVNLVLELLNVSLLFFDQQRRGTNVITLLSKIFHFYGCVTFAENHPFTNPHLQQEFISFNEDEANLNLPNLSNSFFIAPSVVIEFTPTKVGTSELEDVNEKNGSITIVPLRVYSRRRLLNCVSMQTQEFEFVVGDKLTLDILLCHWCLKT